MPSREPELYKDKIEVSLDGRQIFYLFFGGAVIVGLVFVVGVMVGRRVEARGHLDRADTQTASDPLAALDRLERNDRLSFPGALTGGEPTSDVEKAIGELEKRRAAAKSDKPEVKPDAKPDVKAEVKPEAKPEAKAERIEPKADKPEARPENKSDKSDKSDKGDKSDKSDRAEARSDRAEAKPDKGEPITRPDPDKAKADKHDGERKSKKHDDSVAEHADAKPDHGDAKHADGRSDKPVTKPEARGDRSDDRRDRSETKPSEPNKTRFTLQLSSFQDRSEAEAFLAATKSAGFQAYITEADVGSKGTFYRVRFGSYRSLEAANDAKEEYEKAAKKTAQVMRL